MTSMNAMIERYVELYLDKKEISKEVRAMNKEIRELKPQITEYLASQGKNSLDIGDSQIVLSAAPKKSRKKKSEYEDEVIEYLQGLGLQQPERVFEELQELKSSGPTTIVADLKVV